MLFDDLTNKNNENVKEKDELNRRVSSLETELQNKSNEVENLKAQASAKDNALQSAKDSVAIPSVAFFFRNISTLLLRNTFSPRNLDCVAFLFIDGGCEGFLNSVTLLSWFIPTLLFPDGLTRGHATQSCAKQAN